MVLLIVTENSGQYAVCHSEVTAASSSVLVAVKQILPQGVVQALAT